MSNISSYTYSKKFDESLNLELSDNSFSLKTLVKTELIDSSKIIDNKNVEPDDIFTNLYASFVSGKSSVYLTRVSLSSIKAGFYKKKSKRWKYYIDRVNQKEIDLEKLSIRGGHKVVLYVYKNPNDKCDYEYVCPDNIAAYKAYQQLNINKVPVQVLDNKVKLEESAFVANEKYFFSTKIVNQDSYLSILGDKSETDIPLQLDKLYKIVDKLKFKYRSFHLSNQSEIHYNNIVFSMLIRTLELIKSVKILIENDLYLPAINLARSLYELTLTFYISWLCPTFLPFIQLASSATFKELEKIWKKDKEENIDEFIKMMKYQYNIANSVFEKAKISPFGELYYRNYYSYFSKIVHHDFSVNARYRHTLIHGDEVIYDEDIKHSLLFMIDTCVTLIYTKSMDEIGLGHELNINK